MDNRTDPKRNPGLDDEADGLDCFATEGVVVIDTADDAGTLVETHAGLPAVRTPARSALPVVQSAARDRWRQRPGDHRLVVSCAVLLLSILTLWMIEPADRPATTIVADRSAPAPIPPPQVQPAPPIDRPVPQSPAVPAIEPDRAGPQATARTASPVAPAPARRLSAAPGASAEPSTEAAARPVAPPAPAMPVESPVVVVATPEVVRAEPAADAPRAAAVPAAAAAIIVPPTDRSSIERVLQAYQDAYDRLDAPSAAAIWPRVDTRALNRAFSTLAEQDMSFDQCDLAITGAKANARCTGAIRYVRRVGDQEPRVRRLSWSFALERVSDRWQIAQVTAE